MHTCLLVWLNDSLIDVLQQYFSYIMANLCIYYNNIVIPIRIVACTRQGPPKSTIWETSIALSIANLRECNGVYKEKKWNQSANKPCIQWNMLKEHLSSNKTLSKKDSFIFSIHFLKYLPDFRKRKQYLRKWNTPINF